jgi:FKBP-type peptidyl-prolyl cis-trans isomerase FkpA
MVGEFLMKILFCSKNQLVCFFKKDPNRAQSQISAIAVNVNLTFYLRSLILKKNPICRRLASVVLGLSMACSSYAQTDTAAMAAKEKGAVVTASGLVYLSLKEGAGPNPQATQTVKVHYRGTLPDGKEFDSSYKRNEPASFPLNGVIRCWTEGVQRMKVGGKAKLTCPANIAYGERGAGGVIPPNTTLQFEVELLGIMP